MGQYWLTGLGWMSKLALLPFGREDGCETTLNSVYLAIQGPTAIENHATPLHQEQRERQEADRLANPHQTPSKSCHIWADQFCVYSKADGERGLLFVVEYKPPHKLSVGNLKAGFQSMDPSSILLQPHVPAEEEERLQYHAEKLVAAVAIQTFHYMIQGGLEYSYITTGEAFVLLHIKKEDPYTLYYHVSVPLKDVEQEDEYPLSLTALSQVLGLSLMAFQSRRRDQQWISKAMNDLDRYEVDYNKILISNLSKCISPQ